MSAEVADILQRIVRRRRERLGPPVPGEGGADDSGAALPLAPPEPLTAAANRFLAALEARRGRAVIAEIKLGSPRLGSLAGRFDPQEQARLYREGGAAALSVVVEPDFFGGSYELLAECAEASGLPALAKDFVVSSRQIDWAAQAGASAVLLIAALLDARELAAYADQARSYGLVPLVELHAGSELDKLGGGHWELLGVNNRDLRTFEVRLERSLEMLPRLPEGGLRVAESGLREAAQVARLARAGFDAFLVGESLLLAEDPAAAVRELVEWR